jgi:hypothetical protein
MESLTESQQIFPDATLEEYVPKLAAYRQQTECLHLSASAFSKPAGCICCFPNLTEDVPSIMGKKVLSRSTRLTDMPAGPFHNLGSTDYSVGI